MRSVDDAAHSLGGSILWNVAGSNQQDFRTDSLESVHSVYLPCQPNEIELCRRIGEISELPCIELRLQEGSIWDGALLRGREVIDQFSVCPQYWYGRDTPSSVLEKYRGNVQLIAREWNIPSQRIEKYFVNWGYTDDPGDEDVFRFERSGYAYSGDAHPYGDAEQFFDVTTALGGVEPVTGHTLLLPPKVT